MSSGSVPRPRGSVPRRPDAVQIDAIDAWHRARASPRRARRRALNTRESRLDLNRRLEARRREQQALLARAAEQLRVQRRRAGRPGATARRGGAPQPLAAGHRGRTGCGEGVDVVGLFDDGADCAGTWSSSSRTCCWSRTGCPR
jgi:hypothetical protein